MIVGMSEKIKIVLLKRKMSIKDLSNIIGGTPQNISGKLKRDNFSEKELNAIAEALNCDFNANFILRDTGEQVWYFVKWAGILNRPKV